MNDLSRFNVGNGLAVDEAPFNNRLPVTVRILISTETLGLGLRTAFPFGVFMLIPEGAIYLEAFVYFGIEHTTD